MIYKYNQVVGVLYIFIHFSYSTKVVKSKTIEKTNMRKFEKSLIWRVHI